MDARCQGPAISIVSCPVGAYYASKRGLRHKKLTDRARQGMLRSFDGFQTARLSLLVTAVLEPMHWPRIRTRTLSGCRSTLDAKALVNECQDYAIVLDSKETSRDQEIELSTNRVSWSRLSAPTSNGPSLSFISHIFSKLKWFTRTTQCIYIKPSDVIPRCHSKPDCQCDKNQSRLIKRRYTRFVIMSRADEYLL